LGLGFRVQRLSLGFRVQRLGLGFRVQRLGLGFRVQRLGSGFRGWVPDSEVGFRGSGRPTRMPACRTGTMVALIACGQRLGDQLVPN